MRVLDRLRRDIGMPANASGQVLPLFALMLVVLFGMAALAIDVSRVYADLRLYRAAADAAALAGAQELQLPGSRTVRPEDRVDARALALQSLTQRLGGSASGCDPSADVADCPLAGTPYVVSVKTPSPSCSACMPGRSVQVSVRHSDYGLTFARVLGASDWNPGVTSVAGLEYGKSYAIQTLRPPARSGATFDVKDITLDGGTVVTVERGDVGTNANMNYSGTGSQLILDGDYGMFYFDPYNPPMWGASPVGQKLTSLILDPGYRYPSMTGAPVYDDARPAQWAALDHVERADVDPDCADELALVDATRYTFVASITPDKVYCYEPGIYQSGTGARDARINAENGTIALLKPGAYYLRSGMIVRGYLIGGYEPGAPGVALQFVDAGPGDCAGCILDGNNAVVIALNAGTKYPPTFAGGTAATAAIDFQGLKVETSGPSGPTPPLPITILVDKDPGCYVPVPPASLLEPSSCNADKNKTINIAGAGNVVLEGVQYAPTDNVEIGGSSSSNGRVGQIISWTLKYSGGIRLNQEGPGFEGNGILRIDAACSAPGEPCTP